MQFSRVTTRYVPHGTIWFDEAQMDGKDLPRSMWYQIMRLCLGHFATQNMKQRSREQIPLMTTAILPMWELSGLSAGARPWEFYFKDMNEAKIKEMPTFAKFFPFLHTMLLYKSFLQHMLFCAMPQGTAGVSKNSIPVSLVQSHDSYGFSERKGQPTWNLPS